MNPSVLSGTAKKLDEGTQNMLSNLFSKAPPSGEEKKDQIGHSESRVARAAKKFSMDEASVVAVGSILGAGRKEIKEGDVKAWITSKISTAFAGMDIPEDKWSSVEDAVYSAMLAGKLGDGTPSVATAQAINDLVSEFGAMNGEYEVTSAEIPEPPTEVIDGDDVGLKDFDIEFPTEAPVPGKFQKEIPPEEESDEEFMAHLENRLDSV